MNIENKKIKNIFNYNNYQILLNKKNKKIRILNIFHLK